MYAEAYKVIFFSLTPIYGVGKGIKEEILAIVK